MRGEEKRIDGASGSPPSPVYSVRLTALRFASSMNLRPALQRLDWRPEGTRWDRRPGSSSHGALCCCCVLLFHYQKGKNRLVQFGRWVQVYVIWYVNLSPTTLYPHTAVESVVSSPSEQVEFQKGGFLCTWHGSFLESQFPPKTVPLEVVGSVEFDSWVSKLGLSYYLGPVDDGSVAGLV